MGIKAVMSPEELVDLLSKTACLPEIQVKIVGNYAHLYGFIEGIELVKPAEQKKCGECTGSDVNLICRNRQSKQCGQHVSFQGFCKCFEREGG